MTRDDHAEVEEDLPFVSVKSNGGPHDDHSYESGFQMGQLDVILNFSFMQSYTTSIHRSNLKQADLIAMHYEFKMEIENENEEEPIVTFLRVCTCDDPV